MLNIYEKIPATMAFLTFVVFVFWLLTNNRNSLRLTVWDAIGCSCLLGFIGSVVLLFIAIIWS